MITISPAFDPEGQPRKPGALCIGAQKAGTSWLAQMLGQHPQVFLNPAAILFDLPAVVVHPPVYHSEIPCIMEKAAVTVDLGVDPLPEGDGGLQLGRPRKRFIGGQCGSGGCGPYPIMSRG